MMKKLLLEMEKVGLSSSTISMEELMSFAHKKGFEYPESGMGYHKTVEKLFENYFSIFYFLELNVFFKNSDGKGFHLFKQKNHGNSFSKGFYSKEGLQNEVVRVIQEELNIKISKLQIEFCRKECIDDVSSAVLPKEAVWNCRFYSIDVYLEDPQFIQDGYLNFKWEPIEEWNSRKDLL